MRYRGEPGRLLGLERWWIWIGDEGLADGGGEGGELGKEDICGVDFLGCG